MNYAHIQNKHKITRQCNGGVFFVVNEERYTLPVAIDISAHQVYVIYSVPYELPNEILAESLTAYGNISKI